LSLIAISIPFLFTYSIQKKYIQLGIVVASIIAVFGFIEPVRYEPRNDEYYLSKQNFTDGTSSLGNSFSTIWSPWKTERFKSRIEVKKGSPEFSELNLGVMTDSFTVATTESAHLRINRLYYPGWNVYINDQKTTVDYEKDGVLDFVVTPGKTRVRVVFEGTPLRKIANGISIVSLGFLVALRYTKKII
jgi:hypothetical protein